MKSVQTKTQTTSARKLAGKVALVTGGSRGIGAGIALRLAEEGATVAISYARSKTQADEVVKKIGEFDVRGAAYKADATSEAESRKLVEDVIKEFGKIDILINNAGVFEIEPLDNITLEHYDRIFNVNVRGVIGTTIAAVKKIAEGGRIINISSIAATETVAGFSVYSASKAALSTLTRIWAQELGSRKITVNAVAPGATASDMMDAAIPTEARPEIIEKTALGRIGEPEDIAAVVAFLASDDGRWITGQTIVADGGIKV